MATRRDVLFGIAAFGVRFVDPTRRRGAAGGRGAGHGALPWCRPR